jgi:Leucine-rich repeat (LRR) protein
MLTTLVTMQLAGNRGLSGRIPTELCALTNLQDLALQGNQLSGTIPSCLGNMKSLEIIILAANGLTGNIPLELCQLTVLKELHLTLNSLNETIPSCLGSLPLEVLDVGHNLLTGQVPNDIENLAGTMWAFSADDNMLSGDPSAIFNKLAALRHLSASINELTFTMDSTFLVNSPNLKTVDLSDNQIDGMFPVRSNLTTDLFSHTSNLSLIFNNYFSISKSHLLTENYPKLDTLDVSKNKLIGELSGGVQIESPIRFLGAHDNNMTGSLSSLVNLTNLKHVDLSNNQLTGSLEPIGELYYINNIFLSENPFDAGTLPESFGKLPYLQELSLRNTNLIGPLPDTIGENWTYVELIDLGANSLEGPIPETFGNLTLLQYLLLYDNIGINGTVPDGFQNLVQIKGVLLDGTSINGLGALNLFCKLPNFENNLTGTELLVVDCDGLCTQCIGCRCCNAVDSSGCSQPQLGNIDIMWTENFRRPGNEFNFTDDFNLST